MTIQVLKLDIKDMLFLLFLSVTGHISVICSIN
jgi:hypothetical protein